MIPIIVIEGPTASGKSEIAIQLAEEFKTDIISADSRQIYRFMDIGTAKPKPEVRERIVHHLIDIVNPDEEYSAGQFAIDAAEIIGKLSAKGELPIICGGTGFYVKSLLEGLFKAPKIPDKIRNDLEELEETKGTDYLYAMLGKVDPESAERVHAHDSYRIKRALEVWIATGRGIGEHWEEQQKSEDKYRTFRIMVDEDRELLYEKINQRIENMIDVGLISEIKKLLETGYSETDPGMTSVGYKEFIPYIKEGVSFLHCLEEAKKNTRNYAKRQITWYRRIDFDIDIHERDFALSDLIEKVRKFLFKEN